MLRDVQYFLLVYRNYWLVPRRLSLDENVRAKVGGKETTSIPFPWSLAVHHLSLAFRAHLYDEKNEAPEEEAAEIIFPATCDVIHLTLLLKKSSRSSWPWVGYSRYSMRKHGKTNSKVIDQRIIVVVGKNYITVHQSKCKLSILHLGQNRKLVCRLAILQLVWPPLNPILSS